MVTCKILECAASAFRYFAQDWEFLGVARYFSDDRAADRRERTRRRQESRWFGAGAEALGLRGPIKPKRFERLLEGHVPGTGIRLGRRRRDAPPPEPPAPGRKRSPDPPTPESHPASLWQHRPGLDLTCSAPKSVSLEALVSAGRWMRARVLRCHREAVAEVAAFAERDLLQTRSRVPGSTRHRRVPAHGMIAAAYEHVASRDDDPQLHTHLVILNMTRDAAGRWRSADFTAVRRSQLLLGAVYRTALQQRLEALGYATVPTLVGRMPGFEIAGYPPGLIKHFSQRRRAVLEWIRGKGLQYSSRVAQMATLATRRRKRERPRADLEAYWTVRAEAFGPGRDWERARGRKGPPRGPAPAPLEVARRAVEHCEERQTVFPANLVRGWALAHAGGRHALAEIDGGIATLERERNLVAVPQTGVDRAYTTRRALQAEKALLARMRAGIGAGAPLADPARVAARLAASALNAGQREAARTVLLEPHRVLGVQGHAGAGKTRMLSVVADLARRRPCLALAPSSAATRILGAETGLPARTVQWFLVRYRAIGDGSADPRELAAAREKLGDSLLIVDESSMIGTAAMHLLLAIAERSGVARVALVGDRRQLSAVDAGQPFRLLQDGGMPTARMETILRQRSGDLRAVVRALVERDPARAVEGLGADVIEIGGDGGETTAGAAARLWLDLAPEARARTPIVAPTHAERAEIHAAVRAGLAAEGVLRGRILEIERYVNLHLTRAEKADATSYRVGDIVVFHTGLVNYRVRPGDACVVQAVEDDRVELGHPDGAPRRIRPAGNIRYRLDVFEPRPIELRAGDRIRWTRNYRGTLELDNGAVAAITAIDRNRVRFRADDGREYSLVRGNPHLHHLDHAYATTVHGAQGMTSDSVIAVLDAGRGALPDQAAFYVQITRARDSAVLLTDDREALVEALEARSGEQGSALEAVGASITPPPPLPPRMPEKAASCLALDAWHRFTAAAQARGEHPFAADGSDAVLRPVLALAAGPGPGTPAAVFRVASDHRAWWSAERHRIAASRAAIESADGRLAEGLRARIAASRAAIEPADGRLTEGLRARIVASRAAIDPADGRLAEGLRARIVASRAAIDPADGRLAGGLRARIAASRAAIEPADGRLAEGLRARIVASRAAIDPADGRLAGGLRARIAASRAAIEPADGRLAGGLRARIAASRAAIEPADGRLAEGLRARIAASRAALEPADGRLAEGLRARIVASRAALESADGRLAGGLRARIAASRAALESADGQLAEGLRAHADRWAGDCERRHRALGWAAFEAGRWYRFGQAGYQTLIEDVGTLSRARAVLGETLAPGHLRFFLESDAPLRDAYQRVHDFRNRRVAGWVSLRVRLEREAIQGDAGSMMELAHYGDFAERTRAVEAEGRALFKDSTHRGHIEGPPGLRPWVLNSIHALAETLRYDEDAHGLAQRHRALMEQLAGTENPLDAILERQALVAQALKLAAQPVALPPPPPAIPPGEDRAASAAPTASFPEPWPGERPLDQRCNFAWLHRFARTAVLTDLARSTDALIPALGALAEQRRAMFPESAASGLALPSLPAYGAWKQDVGRRLAEAGGVLQRAQTFTDALGRQPTPLFQQRVATGPPEAGRFRLRDVPEDLRAAMDPLQRGLAFDAEAAGLDERLVAHAVTARNAGETPFAGAAFDRLAEDIRSCAAQAEPGELSPTLTAAAESPGDQARVHGAIWRLGTETVPALEQLVAQRKTILEEARFDAPDNELTWVSGYRTWRNDTEAALQSVERASFDSPPHAHHWQAVARMTRQDGIPDRGRRALDALERSVRVDREVDDLCAQDRGFTDLFSPHDDHYGDFTDPDEVDRFDGYRTRINALVNTGRQGELPSYLPRWALSFGWWHANVVAVDQTLAAIHRAYGHQRKLVAGSERQEDFTLFARCDPERHRRWKAVMATVPQAVDACDQAMAEYRRQYGDIPAWPLDPERERSYWTCRRLVDLLPDLDNRPPGLLRELQDDVAAVPPGDANWYSSEVCDSAESRRYRTVDPPWIDDGELHEPAPGEWLPDLRAARSLFRRHEDIRRDLARRGEDGPEQWLRDLEDARLRETTVRHVAEARKLERDGTAHARLRERFPDVVRQLEQDCEALWKALEPVRERNAKRAQARYPAQVSSRKRSRGDPSQERSADVEPARRAPSPGPANKPDRYDPGFGR